MFKNAIRSVREYLKENIIIAWVMILFVPFFCVFVLDFMNLYQYEGLTTVIHFLENHPLSYLFELVVMFLIMIFLILLFKKLWITAGIMGLVSFIMAYADFAKISQNGNNLYPRDIAMLKNAGELLSFLSCPPPAEFWLFIVAAAIWLVLLALSGAALPLRWYIRCPAALLLAVLLVFSVSGPKKSEKVLKTFNMGYSNAALQSSNYKANGFTGAFMINLLSMQVVKPEAYSEEYIKGLFAGYEDSNGENDKDGTGQAAAEKKASEKNVAEKDDRFDIIVVLSESFCDIRELEGVSFSKDPLRNYDKIRNSRNCLSGKLYTNALGGGTVRTEFEILTGLSTNGLPSGAVPYEYVKRDLRSYVSDLADLGYNTTALHLYDRTFYARQRAYGYIGFDEFYALDNIKELVDEPEYKRGYASDESTFEAIEHCMEMNEDDGPQLLSVITIQNHQPFEKIDESMISVKVDCDRLNDQELTSLSTYTQGLYDADQMLGDLKKYIDSRKRPTILVYYGDHLPSLGLNFAVFKKCGCFNDDVSAENREKIYSTPFLIYSNRKIKSSMFENNKDNNVSTYNLINVVFEAAGLERTPYMKLLEDFYKEQPMFDKVLLIPENDKVKKYYEAVLNVTYDRLLGEGYSQ